METNPSSMARGASAHNEAMPLWTKVFILGGITLFLLIPLLMTGLLVGERKRTAENALSEISTKWGGTQQVLPPCLVFPHQVMQKQGDDKNTTYKGQTEYQWLFPRHLRIKAVADVKMKKRAIYQIPIYETVVDIEGEWNLKDLPPGLANRIDPDSKQWMAYTVIGLSDLKGIKEQASIQVGNQSLALAAEANDVRVSYDEGEWDSDLQAFRTIPNKVLSSRYSVQSEGAGIIRFATRLRLAGTRSLGFAPVGAQTDLALAANWASPSFGGDFLPDSSSVSSKGFEAVWTVLDYNRGYPRSLDQFALNPVVNKLASVNFIEEADQYTQTDRSVKYGVLFILLTFVTLFFVEMALKGKYTINVFHYMLTGLALVLFYTLLLSLSEIVGFGWAYLIATAMTIGLLGGYFLRLLPDRMYVWLLLGIMVFLYFLAFLLIQMTTYALLAGSLGLFVILGIIMYFSAKLIK